MWALVKDGSVDIVYHRAVAVTINDIQYPKTIFALWPDSEREAIGVYTIVRKDKSDPNFYDVGTPSYTYNSGTDKVSEAFDVTEKKIAELKAIHTTAVKDDSHMRITQYDWLVTRHAWDNSKTIPSAVTTYTAAVRSHSNTICTIIDGCSDLAAFKVVHAKIYDDDGEYKTGWPDDSNVKSYERV